MPGRAADVHSKGPTVGEPFPEGVQVPPAVSRVYFNQVCPTKHRLERKDVHANILSPFSAELVVEAWVSALNNTENSCVEESRRSGPIFIHYE